MKKQTIVMAGLLIILVTSVVAVIAGNAKDTEQQSDQSSQASQSSSAEQQQSKAATENRTPSPSPSSADTVTNVSIKDYAFGPKDVSIKVGTTVTWTNEDSVRHTVTADKASATAPKSDFFGKGESYSFKFAKAGTYSYYCEPHPYMKASVTVTE